MYFDLLKVTYPNYSVSPEKKSSISGSAEQHKATKIILFS